MKRYSLDQVELDEYYQEISTISEDHNGEYVKYKTAKILREALDVVVESYEEMEMYKAASKLRKLLAIADSN